MLVVWQERLEQLVAGSTDNLDWAIAIDTVIHRINRIYCWRTTDIAGTVIMEYLIQRMFLGTVDEELAVRQVFIEFPLLVIVVTMGHHDGRTVYTHPFTEGIRELLVIREERIGSPS